MDYPHNTTVHPMSVLPRDTKLDGDYTMGETVDYKDNIQAHRRITFHGSLDEYTVFSIVRSQRINKRLVLTVRAHEDEHGDKTYWAFVDTMLQHRTPTLTKRELQVIMYELQWLVAAHMLSVSVSTEVQQATIKVAAHSVSHLQERHSRRSDKE